MFSGRYNAVIVLERNSSGKSNSRLSLLNSSLKYLDAFLYRLSLPPEDIWPVASVDGALTMDMNINEQRDWLTGHFIGSWCLGPAGKNTLTPAFVSFIPAVVCSPNVLVNMVFSMLMHNTWAEGYFFSWDRKKRSSSF